MTLANDSLLQPSAIDLKVWDADRHPVTQTKTHDAVFDHEVSELLRFVNYLRKEGI